MSGVEYTPEQINAQFAGITGRYDGPVRCQCSLHDQPCNGRADVIVEAHQLGRCNTSECNDFGNRVELLCEACARALWLEALRLAADARQHAHQHGGRPACLSCLKTIAHGSDLVVSVKRIPGGVQ